MLRLLAFALLAALAAAPARAGFTLQTTNAAGAPTAAFATTVGGTVVVGVYLVETGGGSVLRDDGLFSAGVGLAYGTPGVAGVTAPGRVAPNPLFTNATPPPSFSPAGAGFSGDVDLGDPLYTSGPNGRIFLGTFTLTGLSAGSTTLTARDRIPGAYDDFLTGSFNSLDTGLAFGSATLVVTGPAVTATPAPATGVAAGLAAGLLVAARGLRQFTRPASTL